MAQDPLHNVTTARHDKVLIVDFGSQVTQLIARRVREAGVYCEIAPVQTAEKAFAELAPKAVILSGGPASVHDQDAPRVADALFAAGVPILAGRRSRSWFLQQLDVPCSDPLLSGF